MLYNESRFLESGVPGSGIFLTEVGILPGGKYVGSERNGTDVGGLMRSFLHTGRCYRQAF